MDLDINEIKIETTPFELTAAEILAILAMRIPPKTPIESAPPSHMSLRPKLITKIETKTFDLKTLVKDKFTMSSGLNKPRFEQLDRILRSNHLYTLATKTRQHPISTVSNPSGYTEESYAKEGDLYVITPADNIPNYVHDLDRLESVMYTAFDKALYHQSQGFIQHDPIMMYTDLRAYFYGRDNNGINAARAALARFKINPTISLKADITLFEEAITNLEYASSETITENIRLSIIDEKFNMDTRIGVRERLTHCQCSYYTYAATMDALKNTPNASIAPGSHHRMNTLQTKSKELCNNFAKGRCTFGERCKYVHDIASTKGAKDIPLKAIQDAVPPTAAPPSGKPASKPKAPFPNYINERHRSEIGTPNGLLSPTNPLGMSRKQHIVLKHLQARDTDWNLSARGGRDSNGNEYGLNMFSTVPSPEPTKTAGEDQTDSPFVPTAFGFIHYHPPTPPLPRSAPYVAPEYRAAGSHGFTYDFLTAPLPTVAESISSEESDDSDTYNVESLNNRSSQKPAEINEDIVEFIKKTILVFHHCLSTEVLPSSFKGYISYIYNSQPTVSSIKYVTHKTSVNLFGWTHINPLKYSEYDDIHVYLGDPHLLELLNVIGNVFLHAGTVTRHADTPLGPGSYNSFSPYATQFNHQPSPGSYTSCIITINDYVHYYEQAARVSLFSETRNYLMLTIIYDFMAFSSQYYRRNLAHRDPTPERMAPLRSALLEGINMLSETARPSDDYIIEFRNLIEIFKAIAHDAIPLPSMPIPGQPLNFGTPRQLRKRPAIPSSDPAAPSTSAFKRPRYSHGHDKAYDDEGEVQLLFSPVTRPRPNSAIIDISAPVYPTIPDTESLQDDDEDVSLDFFSSVPMNTMATQASTIIMDSGAGRTGTSDMTLLKNIKLSHGTTVTGAFGPAITPSHTGTFGPHKLDAVYIKTMGPQTLVSLSQFCNAGNRFIGVFTPTEYRMYELESALPALANLSSHGIEAERGTVKNGIYVRS